MKSVTEPSVLARSAAGVGHLTLNRPRAINALDNDMITQIRAALDGWRDDADVQSVLLDGAGERGLCAGGDVRALYDFVRGGQLDRVADFFRNEYTMNAQIAEYRHPIVALADGVTMGGGIGLAGHAAVRVVTERSHLAMPETRIGFTPDVGGTWLLGRAPGRVGEFLATTCATMDAADAIYAGFADHLVPSAHLGDLRDALQTRADPGGPSELVLLFDETPETSRLEQWRGWIDECFSADTIPEIIDRLHAAGVPEATEAAGRMVDLAPTGMAVTLEAVRHARRAAGLRDVLAQEYGLVMWFASTQPDLVEGIRAQLVDKDRNPRWTPPTPAEVSAETVASAFEFVPARPLWDA
ncbi:enoyl-CoA hydratase/isomerase family protein [Microbacterium sp.]|uniref:enoyl-CoA hydratase/isomerase family protein n=1 Tax=Microbacterium sp. TaxID=51671 RepID=UPI0039C8CDD4